MTRRALGVGVCRECGAVRRVSLRYEGRECSHPIVDELTPYADDVLCQLLVSAHPDGMSHEAIGLVIGLSKERVRQIETEALATLRPSMHREVAA